MRFVVVMAVFLMAVMFDSSFAQAFLQLVSLRRRRGLGCEPGIKVLFFDYVKLCHHDSMAGAAKGSALGSEVARLDGIDPEVADQPWHHVALHKKLRNPEAVDDIFCGCQETDVCALGNCEIIGCFDVEALDFDKYRRVSADIFFHLDVGAVGIEGRIRIKILKIEAELVTGDLYQQSLGGRVELLYDQHAADHSQPEHDKGGYYRPNDFQRREAVDFGAFLAWPGGAELPKRIADDPHHKHKEDDTEVHHHERKVSDFHSVIGNGLGYETLPKNRKARG